MQIRAGTLRAANMSIGTHVTGGGRTDHGKPGRSPRRWFTAVSLSAASMGLIVSAMSGVTEVGATVAASSNPFLIPTGIVGTTQPDASFTIQCPTPAPTSPAFIGESNGGPCQQGGGQMTIFVRPDTNYYLLSEPNGAPCAAPDNSGCAYRVSNFAAVLTPGAQLRVGGWLVQQDYSQYQLTATYIWNPGTNLTSAPPNPKPSGPQDYSFQKNFVLKASVVQTGAAIPGTSLWSGPTGFVVGSITDDANSAEVSAIAAAHEGTGSDPVVAITDDNPDLPNSSAGWDGLTHFFQQQPNGTYVMSTKAAVVTQGAQLTVAGAYGWALGDWRFIAWYVWEPSPVAPLPGYVSLDVLSKQASSTQTDSSSYTVSYSGSTDGGEGMSPSQVTFSNMMWSFSTEYNVWQFSGNWSADRTKGFAASMSGTLSGTWDPTAPPYAINAGVVMTSATGVFCGDTGSGTFLSKPVAAVNPPPPGSYPFQPPMTLDGEIQITTYTPSTPPSGC